MSLNIGIMHEYILTQTKIYIIVFTHDTLSA